MSNSSNWVSHTPNKHYPHEEEEDFVSAVEPHATTPRSPSPPNAFERLFLPSTDGDTIARAAYRVKQTSSNTRTPSLAESLRTEDYSDAIDDYSIDSNEPDTVSNLYINDALGLAQPSISEDFEEDDDEEDDDIMARKKTDKRVHPTSTTAKPAPATAPETETKEESPHFNTVEQVYEGAKSVWAFGKGLHVISPVLGVYESIASKALGLIGVPSLESADEHITAHLSHLDSDLIDPAILKIWSVIGPVVGTSESMIQDIVGRFTSKKIEDKGETSAAPATEKVNPEDVEPELTTPIAAVH